MFRNLPHLQYVGSVVMPCCTMLYLSHVLFFTLSQNTANPRMHDVAFYIFLEYGLDLVEADDC